MIRFFTHYNCFVTLAPSPPGNVRLVSPTSDSLMLQWNEPSMPNGIILHYNYSCTDTNSSSEFNSANGVDSNVRSVTIDGLSPFIEYECDVTASTSAGPSGPGTATGVTGQAGT